MVLWFTAIISSWFQWIAKKDKLLQNSVCGESSFTLKYSEYSIEEIVVILLSYKVKHKGK